MRASISIIVGKGSIAHNSRTFVASNVDKDRIKLNHVYIHSNIQDAYHHLFDDALIKYNDKYGINMLNIGFDCNVVASASRFKNKWKPFPYKSGHAVTITY